MNYKKKANITLIVLSFSFIIVSILKYFYHGFFILDIVFYILEASLIGGMADWFAVTAIFKKPLGFPFHTAIIPNNRGTIVNSIVNIVEKEFLSFEILNMRLNKINITQKLVKWVSSNNGKQKLSGLISSYINENVNDEKISEFRTKLTGLSREGLGKIDVNMLINEFMEWSIKSGEYKRVFYYLLDNIISAAEKPDLRNKIYTILNDMKAEKTQGLFGALFNSALEGSNLVNIDEIADSIHMQLIQTLYNLRDDENLETRHILSALEEHLLLNGKSPLHADNIDSLKEFLLASVITEENIRKILTQLSKELETATENSPEGLILQKKEKGFQIISQQLEMIFNGIVQNERILKNLEDFIKGVIKNVIAKEHSVIGNIVRDTLDAFSDDALNEFIESRAGNDLQWIRINGSIVGGMVGLLVFLFLRLFYDPIAVPFIRHLFL